MGRKILCRAIAHMQLSDLHFGIEFCNCISYGFNKSFELIK